MMDCLPVPSVNVFVPGPHGKLWSGYMLGKRCSLCAPITQMYRCGALEQPLEVRQTFFFTIQCVRTVLNLGRRAHRDGGWERRGRGRGSTTIT